MVEDDAWRNILHIKKNKRIYKNLDKFYDITEITFGKQLS